MTRSASLLIALAALVAIPLAAGHAEARSHRVAQIPNGSVFSCGLCHQGDVGGAPRNAFGLDVEANLVGQDANWAALFALDSDGDGTSNGAELGDPDGTWSPGDPAPEVEMVYAPGVNWTSLLRTGSVCRATGGSAGPRTCEEQLCDAQMCSIDVPCSLEDNTEVCVASGTSFAAATVAGAAALLLSDTARLRNDPVALRAAILAAAPLDPNFVTCGGESYPGGVLDVERLLADNAP